jgi:hypothetical protein
VSTDNGQQLSRELAAILTAICGDDRFGHRQHINLAFIAARVTG